MSDRTKCLREKGEECAECGSTENIEVHYIDHNRWNHALENLAPLCRECHTKIHAGDPSMQAWIDKLDAKPFGGWPSDEEINRAFRDAGIE